MDNGICIVKFNDFMKQLKKDKVIKYGKIKIETILNPDNDSLMLNIISRKNNEYSDYYITINEDNSDEDQTNYFIRKWFEDDNDVLQIVQTTANSYDLSHLILFMFSAVKNPYHSNINAIMNFFDLKIKDFDKIGLIDSMHGYGPLIDAYNKNLEKVIEEVEKYDGVLNVTHSTGIEKDGSNTVYFFNISPSDNDINCNDLDVSFMIEVSNTSDDIDIVFRKLTSKGVSENKFLDTYEIWFSSKEHSEKITRLFDILKKNSILDQEDIDEIMKA